MFSLILFATAAAARVVMDSLSTVPRGWTEIRSAELSEPIVLKIGLRQQQAEALERATLEVSTPGHPNYGMHLSREQVRSFTAPSKRALTGVSDWLRDLDIPSSVDNDWITISTTVERASKLLDARFAWYQYGVKGAPRLRTLSYSIPDELVDHVDLVQPTTRFGQLDAQKSTIFDIQYSPDPIVPAANLPQNKVVAADPPIKDVCKHPITPACLRQLYNIKYKPKDTTGQLVAFGSFLEQYARYSDFADFQTGFLPDAKGQNFSVTLINGGKDDQKSRSDASEANLDAQYILATSYPIPIQEYSTGGRGPLVPTLVEPERLGSSNEPYLEFLTSILAQNDSTLPQTLSVSYGEEEQSVPKEYALKVCNMLMQLGARGVSVLFSSGDSGPGTYCVRMSDMKPYFEPSFPAGCPWVTSVGATNGVGPEQGVEFSSGGFSIYHERPAYQNGAVTEYLKGIGNTYAAYFNASGRGFPDVAAQGTEFQIVDSRRKASVSGTSASAPVFAGVVALLNAGRKSIGQPPLGFLNPWLYNNSATLTDITSGAGTGCERREYFSAPASWNCTKGWDPVTGLGTPNFDAMLAAAAPGVANA